MKKISFLLFLFCMVVAAVGCAENFTAEKPDLIPMVMADNILYIDTGKESQRKIIGSTIDGEITSQVRPNEKPTKNNQSNFGTGYGYQYGEAGTIELFMDGRGYIFAAE